MDEVMKHFIRVEAGTWTCVKSGEFQSPTGRIQIAVGSTFTRGTMFMGFDLARALDEHYEATHQYHPHFAPSTPRPAAD
jgi:hypothetical protein